ncbi:mitotic check point protein BUB2 [Podospora fimiseda]|uniref:Mitotic check point protein BUB2 n=1 Tax=Podospora fimiseda TaxID=252190 RepID=A0AAN7H4B3_9PEZI|nr:mitotic check point protein BUB2 [Podospora fimiseda]
MPSPPKETKDTTPLFPRAPLGIPATMQLHPPPPSPGSHRTLRRLQSAHSLGAKAAPQPSLISQQRFHQLQISQLPGRRLQQNDHPQLHHPLQHHLHQQQPQPTLRRNVNSNTSRSPQRARANSDAQFLPVPIPQQVGAMTAVRRSALSKRSLAADAMSLERLLRDGPPNGDVEGALESTRLKILDQGIKADSDGMVRLHSCILYRRGRGNILNTGIQSSLRIYVWLLLLDAPILETDTYLALIHRGASPAYSKIRNDTFRTLTTDPLFRRRVSEASLIRLLNAIAWTLHDAREERNREPSICSSSRRSFDQSNSRPGTGYGSGYDSNPGSPVSKNRSRALTMTTEGSEAGTAAEPGTYVQGMNVLAAPFLYAARSEAEAFIAFHQLLTKELPGYIRGAMDGVHKGLALVDKVLAIVDPKLSLYLLSKNLTAEIYAFPSVLTLCACTPPLPEVLRLWDFLFAYGPHLNILCIVAQLVMIRTKIMESPSPNKLLRSFPALQADQIKRTTLAIIKMIPDDVYAEIVTHAR